MLVPFWTLKAVYMFSSCLEYAGTSSNLQLNEHVNEHMPERRKRGGNAWKDRTTEFLSMIDHMLTST